MPHSTLVLDVTGGDEDSYPIEMLRQLGRALLKGQRSNVAVLDGGAAELTVEYGSMGDLLDVVMQLDVLRAMASLEASA